MSMLPRTRQEMLNAGYVCVNEHATCRSCKQPMEMWRTTHSKLMPFDKPTSSNRLTERAVTHFATCPNADQHRKPQSTAPRCTITAPGFEPLMRTADVSNAFARGKARIVLAVYDDEIVWRVRNGMTGHEAQQEIITAANDIRRELVGRSRPQGADHNG